MGGNAFTVWRVSLHLRGPTLSEWQADTLWGHLCWALRDQEGEGALAQWLRRYHEGRPPLLLSDGFPGTALPAPRFPEPPDRTPGDKKLRHVRWLTREDFIASRSSGELRVTDPAPGWITRPVWRNTVSRVTGTSLAERDTGGLYALRELWPPDGQVTVYVRVLSDEIARVQALFEALCRTGYGKRRAVGYGAVRRVTWEEERELDRSPPGANGFITLASFIPRRTDPVRGAWGVRVKSPRFGEGLSGPVWKQSLLFLTTGSCFYDDPVQVAYGGLVGNVAAGGDTPAHRAAVQYAFAFPVPAKLPE